jgi:sortase A
VLAKNEDEKTLQSDLEHGVIHYPGTAMPGQRGNVYIAGHSSNYTWSKGGYNYVFKRLNELKIGDIVTIKMLLHNRKEIVYRYVVTINEEVTPDDERIFAQTQSKGLTLTTCWPLGSNARRLMVKAEMQDA